MTKVYESLRKKVYSILYPKGPPLEYGSQFVRDHYPDSIYNFTYMDDDGCVYMVRESDSSYQLHSHIIDDDSIKNLGPDLTLQSILRALRSTGNVLFINNGEWVNKDGNYILSLFTVYGNIELDLTKQPKDRPEETHQSILDLLGDNESKCMTN